MELGISLRILGKGFFFNFFLRIEHVFPQKPCSPPEKGGGKKKKVPGQNLSTVSRGVGGLFGIEGYKNFSF